MGYNTSRVQIPAAVRLEIENQSKVMRNLQEHLRNVFAEVEPGSAIEKSLNKIFDNMDRRFEKLDDIFKEEIFSEGDLARVNKIVESLSDSFSELDRKVKGARLSSLGVDLTEVEAATEALKKLQQQIISIKGRSVASIIKDEEQLKTFVKASKDTGFKGGESYGKNIQILSEKAKDAKTQIADLKTQYEELSESVEASAQQSQLAASAYAKAGRNLLKSQTATEITDIGRVHKTKDARFSAYDEYFKQKIGSGDNLLTDEGKDFAALIGEWLEVDADELVGYADKTADEVVRSLSNALRAKAEQHKKEFGGMNVLQNMAKTELEANKAAGITTAQLQSIYDDAKTRMTEASAEAAEAEANMAGVEGNLRKAEQLLALIESHLEELRKLNSAYNREVDDSFSTQLKAAKDAVREANEAARAVKTTETSSAADSARRIRRTTGDAYVKQRNKNQKDVEDAHEAERFEAELKSSLSHWFSAQQAINMIKDGLRQAWTDIQGLDKAMTNIAVVTDMSVSDLWSKIDQYMAIAQEYGVTTQGVYEVSQLYYQQGLSASEVMEATTETLKMARIAGMDYAEAADAMTVAIRAFKMEMSDAQVITDVYSKVAAVTASDSQELAIAMSKTASSAESVGSSFENTTAMLAVMIETTRESAQNLGSALKSIISRYGEMKVGLTVDSEGEEIDYNKVDTALKSVGISIKDAQGQFRNFDEVIFELSQKWDSLDKNTQRYIATIMAGNRQQSRFIALVDNWERLDEVSAAAHDSADAGLLQYAKTLDSLETKLNALSTSFQQFYMNIVNGDTFKWLIDLITNVLNGLNKIGTSTTILTAVTLVKAIKIFSAFVLNNFASVFSEIRKNYKQFQEDLTTMAREGAEQRKAIEENTQPLRRNQAKRIAEEQALQQKTLGKIGIGINIANIAGAALSTLGMGLTGAGHEGVGSIATTIGNTASIAATGATLGKAVGTLFGGPVMGAITGAVIGGIPALISGISNIIDVYSRKLEFDIEKAKKKAEEKNLERATAAEEERNLKSTIDNLKKLQEARYQSAEAEQAYIDASKEALAAFPELEAQFSSSGDVWIDVLGNTSNAEELLAQAREKTRKATLEAAAAERDQAQKELKQAQNEVDKWSVTDVQLESILQDIENGLAGGTADVEGWIEERNRQIAKGKKNTLTDEDIYTASPYALRALEGEENFNPQVFIAGLMDELGQAGDIFSVIKILQEKLEGRFYKEESLDAFINNILRTLFGWEEDIDYKTFVEKYNTANSDLTYAQKKVATTDRASILAYLDGKENLNTAQKDLLAGWIEQNKTDADFTDNNFVPTDKLAQGIRDYELAISDFTKEQTEQFNKVIEASQKGTMTGEEVTNSLRNIFGDTLPQVVTDWIQQYGLDLKQQINNFSGTLVGQDITQLLPSGETLLLRDGYANLIQSIPDAYYSIISEYNKHLQANIDEDNLKIEEASSSMLKILDLMAGASNEELALLGQSGTDITSYNGLHNFIETLRKSGISEERIAEWEAFEPAVTNFTTEWAAFEDTASSQMKLFEEKVKKATQGMDLEEATEMASQLGISLNDFEYKNGDFFLTDLTALENKYLGPILAFEEKLKAATGETNDPELINLANQTTEALNQYKKGLYLEFYIVTGQFENVIAELGLNDKTAAAELLKFLQTGSGQLSATTLAAIGPYWDAINKGVVDSLSNVWSGVAAAFGTDKIFQATDANRHIYEDLASKGIFTAKGNDLYQLDKNLDEQTFKQAVSSISDVTLKNNLYQQWYDYNNKSLAILEELYSNEGKVDYSSLNDLATKLKQDANTFIQDFFDIQVDGTYKIKKGQEAAFKEILIGQGYSEAQIDKAIQAGLASRISLKKQKQEFLQSISNDSTIEDIMEAQEQGWLTVTTEMLNNIENGTTTVYKELEKAFQSDPDFQIGKTIQLDNITTELNDTFNSLLSDLTSASVEDLRDLHYKATGVEANAGETYAYFNAIQQAKDGNVELLRQYIIGLAQQASLKGRDIDFQIINNTLADTAQQLASTIFGNLESAIEGTLSATDMHDLSQKLNIDVERYAQATIDGYKVTTDGMLKLGTEMMKQYGETYGVAEKMFNLFVGESGVYKGYRDIVKAAVELDETADKTTAEYKAQKKLLTDMAKIAMFNPDDPLFNFMDQDPSRGMALTAQSMVETIDKVKEAFSTLKDGENIAATDFYNMMDFMYDQLGSWDNFAKALGISDATLAQLKISTTEGANIYEQFVNAIVSQSEILGEVDADVLMNLGLSAENMADGMSESLKAVAKDQIKQLEAMKKTLLAMKALEELNIDLSAITTVGGKDVFLSNFNEFLGIDDETDKQIIEAVNTRLGSIKQQLIDNKIITEEDWQIIFGTDGLVNIENQSEIEAAQNLHNFFEFLEGITEQEATEFARRLDALGSDGEIDFSKLFSQIVKIGDWTQFANGLSADVQSMIDMAVGKINEIEVEANGKYKLKDGYSFTDDIAQQIRDIYAANGYQAVEVGMNGEEIEVHIIDAKVKAMIDASRMAENAIDWQYDFDSQTYRATVNTGTMDVQVAIDKFGSVTYTDSNGKPVTSDTVDEMLSNSGLNIKKTVNGENQQMQLQLTAPAETVDATTTIAENVAGIKAILDEGIVISVTDDATSKLETIEETYIRLADTLAARPLVISTTGSTLTGVTSTDNQNEGEEQKSLPTLEQKIKVTWEGLDDWKQEELTQSVKVNYTNIGSWKRYDQTQQVTVNYTVGTVEKPNLNSPTGKVGTQQSVPMVKAKGNIDLLKLGAAYARGTLMGELGPELYVQRGAYHIAGAHGPEFVDLDPDAIVFNHLQTANLLGKGHTSKTGSPVISERRSVAFATGNVTGPAMASGIDSAIEAIDRAIAMWQNIANSTTKELLNNSGKHKGGGSGNSMKAVTEELQEWYNLTRQIRDLEQDITNLQKERANIPEADGEKYLRSLREEQKLLRQQMATQKTLLDYQELQLKRQADHINQNRIWSKFLTVGEDGLLQYIEGNETNGGKGALQVLQELNQMSAQEQTAYLKSIGYSYTDNDGNKLEGEDLVEKFFEELQAQISQYDALYDTVHETESVLENLQTEIQKINDEIRQNQMDLEQAVYDIIVDAWEKEIEQMEEQAELIKEANEAYINGLNDALSAERQMYDDNQKIADREQLQRRLSLLRRSGGSASEIADLEEQLNDMLKDEYFTNQERMIEDIQQANDIQVQQLETTIRLQEEALEYQKEHGVIWQQVYEVLSGSKEAILAFMQGQSSEFFSASLLQQEQMLTEWAHKIGIYTEDRKFQNYAEHARNNVWNNGQAWNIGEMSKYQDTYNKLSDEEKNTIRDQFTSVYAQARMDGKTHEEAVTLAAQEVSKTLKRQKESDDAEDNKPPVTDPNPHDPNDEDEDDGGGGSQQQQQETSPTHWRFTYNGKVRKCFNKKSSAESAMKEMYEADKAALLRTASDRQEIDAANATAQKRYNAAKSSLKSGKHSSGYRHGGLVDFTGPTMVHGSTTKPEGFLNAEQTAIIREGLELSGELSSLSNLRSLVDVLKRNVKNTVGTVSEINNINIASGAVVVQVQQLNDKYDIDDVATDIMNRMYAIGNKSTNRGVSRR